MTTVFTRQRQQGPNRRANFRYAVKIPLRYRRTDRASNSAWKPGRSVDMSARGIRIEIPETMPKGSRLELSMDWPGLYHGTDMVRLFVAGYVTRVDGRGVALRILQHRFFVPAVVRPRRVEGRQAVA